VQKLEELIRRDKGRKYQKRERVVPISSWRKKGGKGCALVKMLFNCAGSPGREGAARNAAGDGESLNFGL